MLKINRNEKMNAILLQQQNISRTKPMERGWYYELQWRCTQNTKVTPTQRRHTKSTPTQRNIETTLMQRCTRRKRKNKKWKESAKFKTQKGPLKNAKSLRMMASWDPTFEWKQPTVTRRWHHEICFQWKEKDMGCGIILSPFSYTWYPSFFKFMGGVGKKLVT
jgi:hypothetical protein